MSSIFSCFWFIPIYFYLFLDIWAWMFRLENSFFNVYFDNFVYHTVSNPWQFIHRIVQQRNWRYCSSVSLCIQYRHWRSKFLGQHNSYSYIVKERITQMSTNATGIKTWRCITTKNQNSCWACKNSKQKLCGYGIDPFSNGTPRHQ